MNQQLNATSTTLWARFGKRAFDVLGGGGLVILLSPILLLTAVLVKLTSAGPVFFAQDRGGKDGVTFRALKFRTMRADRTPDPNELVPLHHTDITRLGFFLRRFKIDELPQLFHVLTGHMSLVGPRPTLPDQVAAYDDFRRQRVLIRPGITGLAQVNSSASVSWDERILYDIAYVRRCSLMLDLSIFARTTLTLLLGEQRTTRPFHNTRYAKYVTPPEVYVVDTNRPSVG
jgi:lipopolysaccharide/colanic/teichoic acid biosynthesis glycosyltransferase